MPSDGKKGLTVRIDAELHAEVRQYLESHEMTMAEFVALALRDELHPKIYMKEEKYMGNMRTLAFQVPEDLFQRIKDYLQRNNMTQKEFVIGLIEDELERDLTERESVSEAPEDFEEESEEEEESTAVSDFETVSEEAEDYAEEQTDTDFSDDFDAVSEKSESDDEYEDYDEDEESEDDSEDEDEDENMGFSMGM